MEFDKKLRASNVLAFSFLIIPTSLGALAFVLFQNNNIGLRILAIFILSFFFVQTFILLHECGHLNFFKSRRLNLIFGHVFGFLSLIPFYTWMHMHNLHHKWTGWRDLDPTTEKTVELGGSGVKRWVVNAAWFLFIPLFFLFYMFSNYWNILKIKRFSNYDVFVISCRQLIFYFLAYALLIYFNYGIFINLFIPGFLLSLIWKELIILTQHTHIHIPISQGIDVRPRRYVDQIQYTRSFYINNIISRYFLLNFNLHEAHHAYPGLPAYYLDKIELNNGRIPSFWSWFKNAKSMKGEDYIFRTSEHTNKLF